MSDEEKEPVRRDEGACSNEECPNHEHGIRHRRRIEVLSAVWKSVGSSELMGGNDGIRWELRRDGSNSGTGF